MFCGHSPGMCGKRADCSDKHCPGRVMAQEFQELRRIRAAYAPEPEPDDEEAWSMPALFFFGIVAVACIAAALQAVF